MSSNKTYELEKRIERIENVLNLSHELEGEPATQNLSSESPKLHFSDKEKKKHRFEEIIKKEEYKIPKLTFNQIITFLGITGIIIGMIFFFFYAVANN